jgi:RimJ/RimL family protein N-acetyltransferase
MVSLKSARITLRPLHPQDAPAVLAYRSDPEIYQFQTWQPKTLAEVEEFILRRCVSEPNLPDTWFQLAICKNDSGELVGDCGLHFLKDAPQQVEIGITLKPTDQHGGYATEALELVFNYIFADLKQHRIFASVDPNNHASIRLLERLKMRQEAHFVETVWMYNRWVDDGVYAILAREWKAI